MYLRPQGTPARPRSRERTRAVRRRRTVAGVVIVAAVAVAIALASSGGGRSAPPSFGGPGKASVLKDTGAAPSRASDGPPFNPSPAAVSSAARLPLAGQVAQLFLIGLDGTATSSPDIAAFASENWGGAVLGRGNFISEGQLGSLAAGVTALARNAGNVPPLVAAPQEGGPATAFPGLPPAGEASIGASGDPAAARTQAQLAGRQLLSMGVNMTFAPLGDVDVLGGAMTGRLFGTAPRPVARFTSAAVSGYRAAGMISAASHFPGAGAASADPDQMSASVGGSLPSLEQRDLVPFAAIASSAPVIMMSNAAYTAFDGVTPAGLDRAAVSLLRDRYGFRGVVMTDDLDAAIQSTGGSAGQAAVSAIQAGDDLLYITGSAAERLSAFHAVLSAVQAGQISRDRIRNALLRVLTLKARYGLLAGSPPA